MTVSSVGACARSPARLPHSYARIPPPLVVVGGGGDRRLLHRVVAARCRPVRAPSGGADTPRGPTADIGSVLLNVLSNAAASGVRR